MLKYACLSILLLGAWVLPPALRAGGPGLRAEIAGGTVPDLRAKDEGRIDLTSGEVFRFETKHIELSIRYDRINTLEYGQHVSRRYAGAILVSPLLLLSKSRRHFVTIGYSDDDGHQQAVVFRVDKNDVRPVLAGLEAKSGRRVEYQDDEARKGKG